MTRRHRLAHRMVWPILAALVALGFSMALALRPAPAAIIAEIAEPAR